MQHRRQFEREIFPATFKLLLLLLLLTPLLLLFKVFDGPI
jgi:hypothetical protein